MKRGVFIVVGLALILVLVLSSCSHTLVSTINTSTSTSNTTTTSITFPSNTTTQTTSTQTTTSSTTPSSTTSTAFVWSPTVDCSTCHSSEVKSMMDTNLLASKHAALGINCLGCHDETQLVTAHQNVNVNMTVPLLNYPQSFCLKCHGSYAALIALTANSQAFLTPDGTAINPHNTHLGPIDCSNCHQIHNQSPGINYCYSCHHTQTLECGECHPVTGP